MNHSTLIEMLGSENYFERQKAAWELVGMGSAAVGGLIEALQTGEHCHMRYMAAWAIGKIGDPKGIEMLSMALAEDPDDAVREWSAAALEAIGGEAAVPALTRSLRSDPSKDVRLRCALRLAALKHPVR